MKLILKNEPRFYIDVPIEEQLNGALESLSNLTYLLSVNQIQYSIKINPKTENTSTKIQVTLYEQEIELNEQAAHEVMYYCIEKWFDSGIKYIFCSSGIVLESTSHYNMKYVYKDGNLSDGYSGFPVNGEFHVRI